MHQGWSQPLSSLKLKGECEKKLIDFLQEENLYSKALNIISSFKSIVTNNSSQSLDEYLLIFNSEDFNEWICTKSFMSGVKRDIIAVQNQIVNTITNSTTEGFVSKIKTIKKRTYGRVTTLDVAIG